MSNTKKNKAPNALFLPLFLAIPYAPYKIVKHFKQESDRREKFEENLKEKLVNLERIPLGYSFPFKDCFDIERKKDKISYSVNLQISKDDKIEDFLLDVWIYFKKGKGQSFSEFKGETPEILDIVEMALESNRNIPC